jgi:hypothetical protein
LSNVIGVAEVLIGAIGLVAAFVIYRWQRQRKGLGVAVLTSRPLLTTPSPFGVSIHHDGKEVSEPRLVILRIANTGNVSIGTTDFERPLSIGFPYCQVLSAEVTGVHPDDLTPTIRTDGPTVIIDPCLLNPTDLIEVQSLLDGGLDDPRIDCRVVGVRSVEHVKLPRDSWGKVWRVSTGEVLILSLAPMLPIGLAIGLFIGGGSNILFELALLLGGMLWFWSGLSSP